MEIRFESGKPIFLQIEEHLRNYIASGRFKPDEKLPGVRELALQANVNPNTMQKALTNLEAEGLIITRGTSGKFVCGDSQIIENAKKRIIEDLAAEFREKCHLIGVSPHDVAMLLSNDHNTESEDTNE
ncbi:MAG: GntR family transcriptional regulator [Clostridia bacterium]|nr:GntR family transcriptional regulator [Clostridia bacterium]